VVSGLAAAADRNHVKVNDMVSIGTMKIIEFAAGDRYNIEEIKPKTHSSWSHQYRGPQQPSREPYVPPTVSRPATVTALPVLNKPSWKQSIDEAIEEVGVGDKIAFIFKTGTVVEDNTKKVKFLDITGKFITTMGVEIDVDGRVDWADDLSEFYTSLPQDDQKRAWCVAEISALGTSTCGGWIRVKDFDLAVPMVKSRDNVIMPELYWSFLANNSVCYKCGCGIHTADHAHSLVNKVKETVPVLITCKTCVAKGENNGVQESGSGSVQSGQSVGQGTLH
jgi:hypothetical protein